MKIDADNITAINFIITPLLYMSTLLPLVQSGKVSAVIFPITILIHTLLYWGLVVYLEKRIK